MSVLAPPEPPPEVARPYDQGSEPSSTRVSEYRTWTRLSQAGQLGMALAAVAAATGITVAGGRPPWEPSVGMLVLYVVVFTVGFSFVDPALSGKRLRRRLAAAEPLPDGAREIDARPLEVLFGFPFLLRGAALGALAGGASLILGGDTSQNLVGLLAGLGAGRMTGLELLLRGLVERTDPERLFYISLEEDDEADSALYWRAKHA